jgi:hypothetical protein
MTLGKKALDKVEVLLYAKSEISGLGKAPTILRREGIVGGGMSSHA